MESRHPKTTISVTDKDNLVCVSNEPTIVGFFFFHLSIELYLIVEHVPNRLCSGLGLTLSVSV